MSRAGTARFRSRCHESGVRDAFSWRIVMPRLILIGAASLAALAFAACGEKTDVATNELPAAPDSPAMPAAADHDAAVRAAQDFVNAAGQAGMVEVQTSEIALKKTKNADVKKFAQMMI